MGCCKCKDIEYGWDDPQPVVFVDPADQQEYCVFHAPKDEKRKELDRAEKYTVEEFNALVFARIDAVKERVQAGETDALCNLNGTMFPGDVYFWQYNTDNPLPKINFNEATFSGSTRFDKATFSGAARFDKATFIGAAIFYEATFGGEARLNLATFSDAAWFNKALFSGVAKFNLATFSGEARFAGATFSGEARFAGATFSGEADFRHAKAEKDGRVVLRDMQPDSLKHLTYTRAELEAPLFNFVNCIWPERLGLEVHGEGDADNLLECEYLYRAMKKRAAEEHDQYMVSRWHFREEYMGLLLLVSVDRWVQALVTWLRLSFEARGTARRPLRWLLSPLVLIRALFSLTFWYGLSSGFGERMLRAGVVLAVLAALPFLFFGPAGAWLLPQFQAGANATAATGPVGGFFAATNATAAMEFIPFTKDIGGQGWMKVAQGLWHVLLIIQTTLFALAVRNSFRR